MTGSPTTDTTEAATPASQVTRVHWGVAALTFLGGLLLGVLLAALLLATTPQFGTTPGVEATRLPGQPEPTDRSTVPVTAEARVNAACLRVINGAQDVVRILSGVDEAASDVDLQRLDDIVRRLQPVETRLQRDLLACRVDTSVSGGSTDPPASPVPSLPQPSGSPR